MLRFIRRWWHSRLSRKLDEVIDDLSRQSKEYFKEVERYAGTAHADFWVQLLAECDALKSFAILKQEYHKAVAAGAPYWRGKNMLPKSENYLLGNMIDEQMEALNKARTLPAMTLEEVKAKIRREQGEDYGEIFQNTNPLPDEKSKATITPLDYTNLIALFDEKHPVMAYHRQERDRLNQAVDWATSDGAKLQLKKQLRFHESVLDWLAKLEVPHEC